jgi:hypothetical protein
MATHLQAPFGGWKLSGIGRELGVEGLVAFRESKHIRLRLRAANRVERVFATAIMNHSASQEAESPGDWLP